jgi:hypothetical protein
VANSDVVVETVLRRQELVAVGTVQPDEFLLKDFVAFNAGRSHSVLRSLFLVHLTEMEGFDVSVQIILHLEEAVAVRAFEHVTWIEVLVDGAHVILQGMETGEGFEAQLALSDAIG